MSPIIDYNPSVQPSNWSRFWGGVKTLGGIGETIAGGSVAVGASWTGIGAVAGGSIAAHGLDTSLSGLKQIVSGVDERSYTAKGLAELSGSEHFADAADAGLGFFGSVGAALSNVAKGFSKINVPALWKRKTWRFGELPYGVLGSTDPVGNIIIQNGLKGEELSQVLNHEMVHRFLSPSGLFQKFRAQISSAAYGNSQLFRFTEEALAETYATGSLKKGIIHPIINGYNITAKGLAGEVSVLGGIVADANILGQKLND